MKRIILFLILIFPFVTSTLLAQSNFRGGNLILEAGVGLGTQKFKMGRGSFSVIGGYTFNEHMFVGGGLTVTHYKIGDFDALSLPLFGRIKYSVLKSKITPFISADIGFDPAFINVDRDFNPDYMPKNGDMWVGGIRGGLYVHPEIGVSYRLHKRKSINFAIGYTQQRGNFNRYERTREGDIALKSLDVLSVIAFRVGFMF